MENPIQRPSRRKAALVGLATKTANIFTPIITGIILVPLYLTHIEETMYGAWLASGNIIQWLILLEAGVGLVTRQQVGEASARDDPSFLSEVVGTNVATNVGLAMVLALASVALSFAVPPILGMTGQAGQVLQISFLMAGGAFALMVFCNAAASVLAGMQRFAVTGTALICGALCQVSGTVVFVLMGAGILAIPGGMLLRFGVMTLIDWPYLLLVLRNAGVRRRFSRMRARKLVHLLFWATGNQLAQKGLRHVDGLFVALVFGVAYVPVVVLTQRVWQLAQLVSINFSSVLLPGLANLYGEGQRERFERIALRLTDLMLLSLAVIGGGMLALNESFMGLWLPDKDMHAGIGFDAFMYAALCMMAITYSMERTLFAAGEITAVSKARLVQGLVRPALLLALLYLVGLMAVPMSLLISSLAVPLWYFSSLTVQRLGFQHANVLRSIGGGLWACLLAGGLAAAWMLLPQPLSWIWFMVQASLFALAAGAALAALSPLARGELRAVAGTIRCRLQSRASRQPE